MKAIKNMSPKAPLKGELKRIPIRKIVSKEQVRKQFQNIEELAQSILMEGLHTPITVEQESEDRYVIIQGERRWRACLHAGLTEIDALFANRFKISGLGYWHSSRKTSNAKR